MPGPNDLRPPTLGMGRPPMLPGTGPALPGAVNPTAVPPYRPQGNFALAGRLKLPRRQPQLPVPPGGAPQAAGAVPGMDQTMTGQALQMLR